MMFNKALPGLPHISTASGGKKIAKNRRMALLLKVPRLARSNADVLTNGG